MNVENETRAEKEKSVPEVMKNCSVNEKMKEGRNNLGRRVST